MYHIDVKKLQAKIVEAGYTQEALAEVLNINRATLRRRLNSASLRICDIHKICEALRLTNDEAVSIFLAA